MRPIDVSADVARGEEATSHQCLPGAAPMLAAKMEAASTPPRGMGTILVVEDQEALRRITVRMLQRLGYTVLDAPGGKEALRLAQAVGPTIAAVVTDVMMPEMDGPALVRKLRGELPTLRVLYVSGHTDDAPDGQGPLGPESSVLRKPFTSTQLAARLRETLEAAAGVGFQARVRSDGLLADKAPPGAEAQTGQPEG